MKKFKKRKYARKIIIFPSRCGYNRCMLDTLDDKYKKVKKVIFFIDDFEWT